MSDEQERDAAVIDRRPLRYADLRAITELRSFSAEETILLVRVANAGANLIEAQHRKIDRLTAERDQAREQLRRITAIVDGWARVPSTMPDAWDAICGVLNERDLMTAPQAQPTPKVKADDGRYSVLSHITITPKADTLERSIESAAYYCDESSQDLAGSDYNEALSHLSQSVAHIIDALKEMQKGGAS